MTGQAVEPFGQLVLVQSNLEGLLLLMHLGLLIGEGWQRELLGQVAV